MTPRLVKHNEINKEKWDACIKNSSLPLIYGLSWYLDASANQQWDGIIWGDYDAVLALPWNRKLIKKQVYVPFSIQRLGVFSQYDTAQDWEKVEEILLGKFIAIHLSVNQDLPSQFIKNKRQNFILDIAKPYNEIKNNFSKSQKNYSNTLDFEFQNINNSQDFMSLIKKDMQNNKTIKPYLNSIFASLDQKVGRVIVARKEGNLLSLVFFTDFNQRISLLYTYNTDLGYQLRANSFLIHQLIKEFANNKQILDFEGSEVPGVQTFFKSFGPTIEYYFHYTKPLF